MTYRSVIWAFFGVLFVSSHLVAAHQNDMNSCLSRIVLEAGEHQTVGELRLQCEELLSDTSTPPSEDRIVITQSADSSAIQRRHIIESRTEYEPFVLTPHKTNYMLFAAYNFSSPNDGPFSVQFPNEDVSLDQTEAKFQLSLKFPIVDDLFGSKGDIYMGYTNRSFWQLYNMDISAPFRETNH